MQKHDMWIAQDRQNKTTRQPLRNGNLNTHNLFCMFASILVVLGMLSGCSLSSADETMPFTETVVAAEPTVMPTEASTEPATEHTEIVAYEIAYITNGGELPDEVVLLFSEGTAVDLPIPTRPGYEFKGWYEDKAFSGDAVTSTKGATGDKTYYAKWVTVADGSSDDQGGSAHTHTYSAKEKVAATCFADGYTVYKCECGDSYKGDYVKTSGHKWEEWIVVKEATSKEAGLKKRSCSVCGYVESETIAKLPTETEPSVPVETEPSVPTETEPAHKHSYTSTVINPTCTSKGYTTYKCACGDSYTANEVAATGHDYESTVIPPTTGRRGYTLHTCKVCGDSYKDNYVDRLPETEPEDPYDPPEIPNHTHAWGEWIQDEGGWKYRICPECGAMDIAW